MSARERPLRRRDLDPDPLRQFEHWYEEAGRVVEFPETVALATATEDGSPSVRMVLAKGFDERGFKFHTGHGSRKARELAATCRGALLFYWHPLGRQVRVEGPVERVSDDESEEYFRTRPRGGQIAAWASAQSEVIGSREELEARVAELEREFEGRDVPLPPHWGGYRLQPEVWEFWQHRESRLHDRFRYER
ncbi:MAG TPA: pyridoxamine 5'-phosphate oxidase, partial [Gaiellaceae bacterium]|nr:pyridoxamine 5'-phosphate oxidase [Gaiellaceae bacterium]